MKEEKIKRILEEDEGFLCLGDKTAQEWHDMCYYYLSKIKDHEFENKHIVREYGIVKTNFDTNKKEYRKLYICENCGKVFLKYKYDPELLKIKEFYQMCFDGKLTDLAEMGIHQQVNNLSLKKL